MTIEQTKKLQCAQNDYFCVVTYVKRADHFQSTVNKIIFVNLTLYEILIFCFYYALFCSLNCLTIRQEDLH